MQDLIQQITIFLRGMWKYRRLGVAVAWLVAAGAATTVLLMPDRYEASARVYVDTQSILRPLMAGLAIQPNIEQQINMLSRTLISRPTVEKLVRMADLDLGAKSKAEQEALIAQVTDSLSIRSTGRDNLYTLAYQGESPEKALRVVQSLMTVFVESSLGSSKSDSDTARRFVEEQIKNYEARLTEAETRLKEFRLRNLDIQSQGGLDTAGRLGETTNTLNQARLDLREAESARDAARRQLDAARAAQRASPSQAGSSFATPDLDARIDPLKRNLDSLLQRYTDLHPDVTNTRRLIKELEEQKREEVAKMQREAAANPGQPVAETNPALFELSRINSAAEVQVASLRARVAEYESRVNRARESMKVAPQVEAEQAQLNRDYEINRKNYEDLVARREALTMSGELESASSVADFRVIDPPRANPKPVAPNRVLLLPLGLLGALAAGLGVTFLMSQIRPVFFDANSLRIATDLPLLGVVTLVKNDVVKRREARSLYRFTGSVVALVVVFLIGMAYLAYRSGFGR
ncbi:XrtA system polysaccharide chain length determinant [Hydrogenophaga sp. PBL-H3]|uniref:XrtA system polysaccharide chain length determinant n=1 Tax=Hydrogenophaga sp. PBL-H3 TaxID=434010 RepID=UPI00131F8E82|nr:XrtA system polysaccharide chain length determinant [Hydrogenophaga sp. PBL-H3]QHE76730.1 chain length-determining protein [Hydrogenophaga sp. PBL-H3]QHE81154.1 chain length-determining protein [Hydrogenophaga sp. PBL-H3]